MREIRRVVSALTLGSALVCGALASGQPASAQAGKRAVVLEISVLEKKTPPMRVTAREGETAELQLDDVGKFGFTPSFKDAKKTTVTVTVFDQAAAPPKPIAEVQVEPKGAKVETKTKPAFAIGVVRIIEPQ